MTMTTCRFKWQVRAAIAMKQLSIVWISLVAICPAAELRAQSPVSPRESLKQMVVDNDLVVQLVAADQLTPSHSQSLVSPNPAYNTIRWRRES